MKDDMTYLIHTAMIVAGVIIFTSQVTSCSIRETEIKYNAVHAEHVK